MCWAKSTATIRSTGSRSASSSGIKAVPGQVFFQAAYRQFYCPNCAERLYRHSWESTLFLLVFLSLVGGGLTLAGFDSPFASLCLGFGNFFIQLFALLIY